MKKIKAVIYMTKKFDTVHFYINPNFTLCGKSIHLFSGWSFVSIETASCIKCKQIAVIKTS